MTTLNKIQKWFKFFKVISMIAFVLSIIGSVFMVIGFVLGSFMYDTIISLLRDACVQSGTTLEEVIVNAFMEAGVAVDASIIDKLKMVIVGICAMALVSCIVSCILNKKLNSYCKDELSLGTPFAFDGADKLRKIAKTFIVCGIIVYVASSIVYTSLENIIGEGSVNFNGDLTTIVEGALLWFASLIFRHGAEVVESVKQIPQEEELEEIEQQY